VVHAQEAGRAIRTEVEVELHNEAGELEKRTLERDVSLQVVLP